ncbi:MAG: D-alanyl-D-alanine carboxypeptidase [Chitinophagaceae bacterium]
MGSSFIIFLSSCSVQKQIAKSANKDVLDAVPLQTAHVGISIYEPSTDKYWYDYQGDKYFVPASNTKIPTCYAAMKYLGDSLVGLKYKMEKGEFVIQGTADPTFLHKDFKDQPVFDFIKKISAISLVGFSVSNWQEEHWGSGWSWNDYNESYMTERSPFPIYANLVAFSLKDNYIKATPSAFDTVSITYLPGTNPDSSEITREISSNYFAVGKRDARFKAIEIPFTTKGYEVSTFLLNDTVKAQHPIYELPKYLDLPIQLKHIYSQPTDSVLKPMMHRSDNFFAEQLLLMVSNERLGIMNDERIIDTLLKTDFKDLPQKPGWVDGSGLSRYNLFTPKDFIFILNKMKNEFGMERVKIIFPTGGEGTLADYYVTDSNYIYAKTGTLSGVIAISGYLYTKKGKELIFSVLVNNHKASGTEVRRAVEKFLHGIRNKY